MMIKNLTLFIKIKFKIYLQVLLMFFYEVCWEFYWWTDGLHIKFYKWLANKEI